MIKITIHFKNDPSVGLQPETYEMQVPDFREGWTETPEMLKTYIGEKRNEIAEMYDDFQGESYCSVMFQWELEEFEKEELSIEEKYGTIEDNNEGYDQWEKEQEEDNNDSRLGQLVIEQQGLPSQVPVPGWLLCDDGLYRPKY